MRQRPQLATLRHRTDEYDRHVQDEHRCQINANANSIITTAEMSKRYRGLGGVEEKQYFSGV